MAGARNAATVRQRLVLVPVDGRLQPERGGRGARTARSTQPLSRWWSWLPGTITTSAPAAARPPTSSRTPRGRLERIPHGAVAQLDDVAEQHQPVDAGQRPEQRLAPAGRRAARRPSCASRGAGRRRPACAGRTAPSVVTSAEALAIAWRMALGSMNRTSSCTTSSSSTSLGAARAEELDEPLHELLGGAGAGGDPDDPLAVEPLLADLELVVDQVGVGAVLAGDLDQPVGVRRVPRADHQHQLALTGELLDGRLAVGRRVTDVVGARTDDRREPLAQPVDDRARLVHRQGRLGDVGDLRGILRPRARRRRPRSRSARCAPEPPPSCPRPPRGRHGRRARSCSPRRRTSSPRRGPSSPAGRSRRSSAARAAAALAWTLGATPCAENTTVAPSGTSVSESTNTAPRSRSCSTTCLLWTISLRTYTGAP